VHVVRHLQDMHLLVVAGGHGHVRSGSSAGRGAQARTSTNHGRRRAISGRSPRLPRGVAQRAG
jgi:hypothetical protein